MFYIANFVKEKFISHQPINTIRDQPDMIHLKSKECPLGAIEYFGVKTQKSDKPTLTVLKRLFSLTIDQLLVNLRLKHKSLT